MRKNGPQPLEWQLVSRDASKHEWLLWHLIEPSDHNKKSRGERKLTYLHIPNVFLMKVYEEQQELRKYHGRPTEAPQKQWCG